MRINIEEHWINFKYIIEVSYNEFSGLLSVTTYEGIDSKIKTSPEVANALFCKLSGEYSK